MNPLSVHLSVCPHVPFACKVLRAPFKSLSAFQTLAFFCLFICLFLAFFFAVSSCSCPFLTCVTLHL